MKNNYPTFESKYGSPQVAPEMGQDMPPLELDQPAAQNPWATVGAEEAPPKQFQYKGK